MRSKTSSLLKNDDPKKHLLDVTSDYGSFCGQSGKRKKQEFLFNEVRKSGFSGLFRYASRFDKIILSIGLMFSIIHGASFPILALVFGEMTDIFMNVAKFGFIKTSNVMYLVSKNETNLLIAQSQIEAAKVTQANLRDSGIDMVGLTEDEFINYMAIFSFYYLCIGVGVLVASFIQTYCWELASERQIHRLRQIFFLQLLRQDVSWYDQNKQGDFNTKLMDDLERVREGIGSKFSIVIQYLATFGSGLSVGLYANWKLTSIILFVGPILILTSAYSARAASTSAAREQLKYSIAGGVAEEVLTCLRTVVAFGCGQRESRRYERALDEGRILAMKRYYVISAGIFFVFFAMYSSYGLAFWYGSELVSSGISTTGSIFTVFFSVMVGAFSIGNALPYINSVSTAIGAASTVFEVIDRVPLIDPYSVNGFVPEKLNGFIKFRNVVFIYPSRPDIKVLRSLSLNILPSQKVAIVGPSGAGKSTIANLLMRFYDPYEGQVLIDGHCLRTLNLKWLRQNIGIVSQEPVLFGVSIFENIAYGMENVNRENIITAAKLANAHSFIESLPQGYDTIVGAHGAQLSGGQKQRIAIARALVNNPKILLFDEATSALDAVSEGIVQRSLENAMKGRTTIIIAHRLSTIRSADYIYVIKDGFVEERGSHDELMDCNGLYYNLFTAQAMEMGEKELNTLEKNTENKMNRVESLLSPSIHSVPSNEVKEKVEGSSDVSMIKLLKMNAPEWHWLLGGLLSCSVTGLIMPTFAFFYGEVFSTFTLTGEELKKATLFWSCMFVALGAVSGLCYWSQIICMSTSAEKLVARLRYHAMMNILSQPIAWFDQEEYSPGHLITRLARDAPLVKAAAGLRLGQVVSSGMTLVAALCIAFLYGWKLASILLIAVPLLIAAGYHQTSLIRKTQRRDTALMDHAGRLASECVQNVTTVQSLGKEQLFHKFFCEYLLTPFKESKKQALIYAVIFALSQTIVYIMYAAAFRFGAYLISIQAMLPGDVYRVFFALSFCATSLGSNTAYLQDYTKAKYAAKLIFELITMKSDVDPLSQYGVRPVISGKITFKDVHFSYPARKDVSVLRGINLKIKPGQTVALVGGSGCGKSTIVSLLERFYATDKGIIMVDDVDIRVLNLSYLRNSIGLVIQEPVLFDCSIKENIAYGLISLGISPTDQDIIQAAKIANIHDFIVSLPLGYETPCGERGTHLSGGQKQRIAIARAIIRDPKILLLDEATSALDTENEKTVQAALDKARIGRTTIIIAHRLSTIRSADKIAVIHQGKIVEFGRHENLMTEKGIYYNLIKRQQF